MTGTLVDDDEPPRPVECWGATTTTAGVDYTLVLPDSPAAPVVMSGVAVQDIRAGDAAELVIDPHTGRGMIRLRRG